MYPLQFWCTMSDYCCLLVHTLLSLHHPVPLSISAFPHCLAFYVGFQHLRQTKFSVAVYQKQAFKITARYIQAQPKEYSPITEINCCNKLRRADGVFTNTNLFKQDNKIILTIYPIQMPSVVWCCWLGIRKSIKSVKNLSGGNLAWLSVCSKVQTCIWPSWCHCHSMSLASVKSRLVLPFWYLLTQVVQEKRPLNMYAS